MTKIQMRQQFIAGVNINWGRDFQRPVMKTVTRTFPFTVYGFSGERTLGRGEVTFVSREQRTHHIIHYSLRDCKGPRESLGYNYTIHYESNHRFQRPVLKTIRKK